MPYYHPHLKNISRSLRRQMTETEIRLWNRIRKKQINNLQFFRQKPVGKYIVDFYCPAKDLVIEIDGSQHYEKEGEEKDIERDDCLKELGYKVLRFTNLDVFHNLEGVVDKIMEET